MRSAITLARPTNGAIVAAPAKKRRRPRRLLDSPSQFARRIGVSERTLLALAAAGIIPSVKLGRKLIRFHPATANEHFAKLARESITRPDGDADDGVVLRGQQE